jgi:hypothetical protein
VTGRLVAGPGIAPCARRGQACRCAFTATSVQSRSGWRRAPDEPARAAGQDRRGSTLSTPRPGFRQRVAPRRDDGASPRPHARSRCLASRDPCGPRIRWRTPRGRSRPRGARRAGQHRRGTAPSIPRPGPRRRPAPRRESHHAPSSPRCAPVPRVPERTSRLTRGDSRRP